MKQKRREGYPEVKIGELAHPEPGSFKIGPFGSNLKKDELVKQGIPVVGIENILANRFDSSFHKFITAEKYQELSQYQIQPFDVLVTTMGTIGRAAVVPDDIGIAIIDSHLFRMRVDQAKVDPTYLCYAINSYSVKEQLTRMASGAIMAGLNTKILRECTVPLPRLEEQQHIAAVLNEQMAAVEKARAAAEAQLELADSLIEAYLRQSLTARNLQRQSLGEILIEVSNGVGERWQDYPVIGATREGLASAKEKVGKTPGRYKVVDHGTVFYNPMRIMIGSIAIVDDDDVPGITSPDYVVVKTRPDKLHPRWFYYWFRSTHGQAFIKSTARGAVRERLMFTRLKAGEIELPPWEVQSEIAEKLKTVATLKKRVSAQLAAIEQLPGVLLRRAFAGGV